MVGVPFDDDGTLQGGAIYVFYGTATGVDAHTEQEPTPSEVTRYNDFGRSVAAGGDGNGDGDGDVLAAAYYFEDDAYVLYGSATGLQASNYTLIEPSDSPSRFGVRVAMVGDVDADGYDEVLVGDDEQDS